MTKIIPTYGYSAKGETQLFQLEEGKKLPSGWHDAPQGDLKNGAVTPPDSTSLRQIPAPEAYDAEIVKNPSENPNDGVGNYTPTDYPHFPGNSDIHPDDENHDGIDERLDPATTFNKPVVPRDVNRGLADVDPAPAVDVDGKLKDVRSPAEAAAVQEAAQADADKRVAAAPKKGGTK